MSVRGRGPVPEATGRPIGRPPGLHVGAADLRIAARGTLTLREVGILFAGSLRDQLPATLRFAVDFRDANNHRISPDVSILITPPWGP